MKRWTALQPGVPESRWRILEKSIANAGCPNEFIPWAESLEGEFFLPDIEKFDHIRLSTRIASQVLKQLKVQSSWTTMLGVVDGFIKREDAWWPQCALHENFCEQLIRLGQDLDMRASVMVAGAGGAARAAIAAFFKAGFRKFLVTNFDESEAAQMIQDIRRRFFNLDLQWVDMNKIVLLPGESAVLVNCTPVVADNALLSELSYLNFLKRPGCLFDLSTGEKESSLAHEAKDAGVQVINGLEMAAGTDIIWADWAFQTKLDASTYLELIKQSST